jgi:hypothetical protein
MQVPTPSSTSEARLGSSLGFASMCLRQKAGLLAVNLIKIVPKTLGALHLTASPALC